MVKVSNLIKLFTVSTLVIVAGCSVAVPDAEQMPDPGYRLGNPDAKVTIVEYSDYECPFCGRFHADAFTDIKANYIDTGLVSFEFRDYPLPFHADARPAAQASYCAGEQGGEEKYWEMSARLFEGQDDLSFKSLVAYGEELGLDGAELELCIKQRKYTDVIDAKFRQGIESGVSGTPSIIINDVMISGAQPFSEFQTVIEQFLAL